MEVDAIVVGLGPGGEEVAGSLAEAGLEVAGIEAELVGGECPYWGCIPSKMIVRAADLLAEGRRIPGMAGSSVVTPDWSPVARRIREEATDSWDDTVAVQRFEGKGGRFVRGRAHVTGPASVEVNGEAISARRALVLAADAGLGAADVRGRAALDEPGGDRGGGTAGVPPRDRRRARSGSRSAKPWPVSGRR